MQHTTVVVVGAGPTGLLLAAELALQGVRVTVLERLAEPDPTIKAGSINIASAEILDRRGLLPAAERVQRRRMTSVDAFAGGASDRTAPESADAPEPAGGAEPADAPEPADGADRGGQSDWRAWAPGKFPAFGHFAGMLYRDDLLDQSDPVLAAHTAAVGGFLVPQHDLETLLGEHCARLGVEIRRGVEVYGVRDGVGATEAAAPGEGVVLETSEGELSAEWVVAADGGRSVLRKQVGIEFDGTDPQLVGYQAIADFDDPSGLSRGWTWTPRGIYAYGPIPGRILVARFGPQPEDRNAPVTVEELQSVVRYVTGTEVTIRGVEGRATRWSDNARQARSYRRGRVLLAGDAAHVHSPFSGQGLNLGLGDAVNLGWKLAATVAGWAPDGLLDTYGSERRPIAAWVLDWTRAQVALMRGDEHTAQLRRVVRGELFTVPGVMNRMIALTAGIEQRYDVADAADVTAAAGIADTAAGAGALVGSIAGDVALTSGGRLADHAHDGRFVLVDRSPGGDFAGAVDQLKPRIAYVPDPASGAAPGAAPDGAASEPSLLVRPDGVIAWAAASSDADASERLGRAIRRWIAGDAPGA
ncbi:FAD-dependent oxidoreductase [Streptomyces varsoviensis]|uniref:FAD-dependent oxidoreductase n=1 Tax=Streptomyces varsoviensis TaxID=67373 RepID=UPI003402B3FF